jgi:oxaloacetate decarboxylase gamma subunit
MTIVEMFQQSAILTVLGMGIVFCFLWLMIICVNVVAKIIAKFGLDKDIQAPKTESATNTEERATSKITAAIIAAVVERHKKTVKVNLAFESGGGENAPCAAMYLCPPRAGRSHCGDTPSLLF